MPDFFTLFVVVLFLNLSHCVLWGMIACRYTDLRATRYWLFSSAAGAVGGMVLASQGDSGLIIQTVAGNSFIILGFYLNWCGLRQFHGDAVRWKTVSLLLGGSVVFMLSTFEVWYGHNPTYTLAQSVPLVLTALYLMRFARRDLGAAVSSIAMTMGAVSHCVIAGGNILIVANITPKLNLYPAASIDLLVFLFVAVIWNFGFLISAVERGRTELERLANEDELTGIANRRQFVRHLENVCDAPSGGEPFSVLLFDLDRFKPINDKYGHAAGDAALKHVAGVIVKQLRRGDVFARIGGDEFGLVLRGASATTAAIIADQIINAIRTSPLCWQSLQLPLTVSVGIVSPHGPSSDPEILLDCADRALYETKRRGKNGYSIFDADAVRVSNVIRLTDLPSSGSPRT